MKNKRINSLLGIIIVISALSIIMAGTMQQLLFQMLGFSIMIILSCIRPEFWMKNVEKVMFAIFFIASLKGYFHRHEIGISYLLKWGVFKIRLHTFILFLIPLSGIWIYKISCRYKKEHWYKELLIVAWIEMICVVLARRISSIKIWLSSFVEKSDKTYIYDILKEAHGKNRIWGESVFYEDILYYLPEAKDTLVLTYYISKYGVIIGCGMCILMGILVLKIFWDIKACNAKETIVGSMCTVVISFQLVLNIMVNGRLCPMISHGTFMPFFTQNFGETLFIYILMGIILSVYRYYLNFDIKR